jgi:site-specific recombinase XerD
MVDKIIKALAGEIITAGNTTNSTYELAAATLFKNVSKASARIYQTDAKQFGDWLGGRKLDIQSVAFSHLSDYRAELAEKYKNPQTAARKLVVVRRLLDIAVLLGIRTDNPAKSVKGFKNGLTESPHRALRKNEAKELLAIIDRSTKKGKRDYALLMLLLRTGIRRSEAANLTLADLQMEQGHHIAVIRHGKGNKRRIAKLPVDVHRSIIEYIEAVGLKGEKQPLFVTFRKGDHPQTGAMNGLDIQLLVEKYAKEAGIGKLTPHGLRASFVTLTLEAGAKLEQVQYAAGHADPRTTERYQKRKLNLDDNAVDFLRLT